MKLIKLSADHYIIVDETEIKDVRPYIDMYHLEDGDVINKFPTYLTDLSSCKLITHSTQPLERICCTPKEQIKRYVDCKGCDRLSLGYDKVQQLSLSEVKELLGEVDVENKAIEWYNGEPKYNSNYVADPYSWKEGYNQSLEDNKDRKYTEEDMRAVFMHGFLLGVEYLLGVDRGDYSIDMEDRAMSHYTQPKTQWDVTFVDSKLKLI
jgi:hypothetical protein